MNENKRNLAFTAVVALILGLMPLAYVLQSTEDIVDRHVPDLPQTDGEVPGDHLAPEANGNTSRKALESLDELRATETIEAELDTLWQEVDTFAALIDMVGEESDNGVQVRIEGTGKIECMKQEGKDLWLMDLTSAMNVGGQTIPQRTLTVFDGTNLFIQGEVMGQVNVVKMDREKDSSMAIGGGKAMLEPMREKYTIELLPDEIVEGEKVYVLSFTAKPDAPADTPPKEMRYISQETGLVVKTTVADETGRITSSIFYKDFQLNPKLDPSRFKYAPAEGVLITDMTDLSSPPRMRTHTEPGRVVSFPQDRSLGRLLANDQDSSNRWQHLAEARGDVTVPAGKVLTLIVSPNAFDDLSPLASLDQNVFQTLDLTQGEVGDAGLEHVAHLRSLRKLDLKGLGVTDVGIAHIAKLKQLEILGIVHTRITDVGLAMLAQLPLLRKVTLDENVNLTDAGLQAIGEMDTLRLLSLDFNPQLTDALVPHLARLTSLEHLFLSQAQLTDEGLAGLHALSSLQRLSIEETQITDEGLLALDVAQLPFLQQLVLSKTQITDDGLVAFQGMRSLRKLWLSDTGVTEAGVARLHEALPGCQIDIQSDTVETPSQAATLKVGDPAPALAIAHWVKGDPVTIADGKNKNVYVVEFWATWCPPCRTSIPHLSEIQKTFKKDGVIVVGVSAEDVQAVEPFVQAQQEKMDYTVAVDLERQTSNAYMTAAGQNGIPCAFVVDQSGAIAWIGHPMREEFESTLARLVQNPNREAANQSTTASGAAALGTELQTAVVTGSYTLVSVDGHPLPHAPMHQGQQGIEVTSGTISLKDGGAFVSSMSYGNRPANWPARRDYRGTYTRERGTLTMQWEGAGKTEVTINDSTLVMDNEGMLFVYELRPEASEPTATTVARPTETFILPGDVPLVMLYIPAGTFMMGTTNGDSDETPVHEVTISRDFQLGQTEVTKAQWEAVMGTRPWSGQSSASGSTFVPLRDSDTPALDVRWDDAQSFITTLNNITGETFRLPTEAEWEYACRAGTTTEYYFGDSSANLSDYAWWDGNADDVGERYAHAVAQLIPNDFGLYDMHGNVWEWCADWYDSSYYSSSPSVDPTGPPSGPSRVIRGGTWYYLASSCRSANRSESGRRNWQNIIGFRLCK